MQSLGYCEVGQTLLGLKSHSCCFLNSEGGTEDITTSTLLLSEGVDYNRILSPATEGALVISSIVLLYHKGI